MTLGSTAKIVLRPWCAMAVIGLVQPVLAADAPHVAVGLQFAQAATSSPPVPPVAGGQKDVFGERNSNENTGQLQPKQVAVSDIVGKRIITLSNTPVGTVDEIITDGQKEPFAVATRNGQQYAVDLSFAYLKGNDLILSSTLNPDNLPRWSDAQLQSPAVQKLSATQTVTMAAVVG